MLHDQAHLLLFSNNVSRPLMWFNIWFVACPIILFTWWGTATERYLKMPHPWGVAAVVTIVGCLVALWTRGLSTLAWIA